MTDVTVKALATQLNTPVDRLVQQLADAGMRKTENDSVTPQEQDKLRAHQKNTASGKLTLQRKTRSTLNVPSTGGKSKSVQIEVRKKRTYVKEDAEAERKAQAEAEAQAQREAEEKARLAAEEAKRKAEEKAKREAEEAAKRQAAESNKVTQQNQTMNKDAQSEKARREAENAELKRKAEEEARRKIEAEAQRVAEEARRLAEEKGEEWEKAATQKPEEEADYHVTTSQHARQAEDENDREVEGGRGRTRSTAKAPRAKKGNKHSEAKTDREEARAAGRGGKGKHRGKSSLQQGFNKPAQVVNRDVQIGETITVAELANKMAVKGSQVIKAMIP